MYFNLKEMKDSTERTRSPEFYLQHGEGTLRIENQMIIFCDSTTKELIKPMRDSYVDSALYPTVYIEKNIDEYEYYKLNWDIINEHRQKYPKPDSRNTSSYFLATVFKFTALKIAAERNDFDTTHYFWVDFGIKHVIGNDTSYIKSNLNSPNDKISLMYIDYKGQEYLKNMAVCDRGFCGVATTFFSMEKSLVTKLYTLAMSIFYEMLFKETGHADEQIMTYCYHRSPQLFGIYYGDYMSVVANYKGVKKDMYAILNYFADEAIKQDRVDLAKKAAFAVLEGLLEGNYILDIDCKKHMERILLL
jgi:Bacterial protein of unknown function (HtrL_YibB)